MRTTVAVLRGGPSSEYDVSLKTGGAVLAALDRERYDPRDIFISKSGEWHRNGIVVTPTQALRDADVAFNALHGQYGEDGGVQRTLDTLGVPYTGSGAFASAQAFNKHLTREAAAHLGIKVAQGTLFARSDTNDMQQRALKLFRTFPMPVIIKPVTGGSSVGVTLARDFPSLMQGIDRALEVSPKALIEEYIRGREATVGVIDHFRGEKSYALLPIEIVPPPKFSFFDYEAKYGGASKEVCPGNFSVSEKQQLSNMARRVHEGMELSHYSRSDFIVSKRGIYFLEVNTLPGLTKESLLPKALHAVGAKFSDFLDHLIALARGKKAA